MSGESKFSHFLAKLIAGSQGGRVKWKKLHDGVAIIGFETEFHGVRARILGDPLEVSRNIGFDNPFVSGPCRIELLDGDGDLMFSDDSIPGLRGLFLSARRAASDIDSKIEAALQENHAT